MSNMKIPAGKRPCIICGFRFTPYACQACNGNRLNLISCPTCHWRLVHAEDAAVHERTCLTCGCRFLPRTCIVPGCGRRLSDICTVCHEEQSHMGMRAVVWELPDCDRCKKVTHALVSQFRKVIRRDLAKLGRGEDRNVEAMAQLALADYAAPLVYMDGGFLGPDEIDALITSKEPS